MNRILPLALLAVASAAVGFFLYVWLADNRELADDGFPPLPAAPRQAEYAPQFTLPDLEGTPRSSTEWDGTIRVVNFWATWCPPCIREIPLLMDIQREYAHRDVRVIGIAVDETQAVLDFAAEFEFNYPVLIGQEDAWALGNQFLDGFIGLPFTAFADRSGRIVRVHTGELHREQLEAILAELL
jgi:thiol-disulfide isomerase/thioredoxin